MDASAPAVDEARISVALGESWGLEVASLQYEPKGFASYHWTGVTADGGRWFVKLDGLEGKPYLGEDPDSARAGLEAAYETARSLAAAGLEFVVGPLPTRTGRILVPLETRWALSVFPFVSGAPGEWGRRGRLDQRCRLTRALGRLHAAGSRVRSPVRRRGWELPGRASLETALDEVGGPWSGGPYSEPARRALRDNEELIRGWLATLDSMARTLEGTAPELVVTHGEPHPGNAMTAGTEVRIVDWDTVALAPAERDLWMLADDPEVLAAYEAESGRPVDPTALAFYRLTWALADVAAFIGELRRPHGRNRATEHSWRGLLGILAGTEPAPYGPPEPPR